MVLALNNKLRLFDEVLVDLMQSVTTKNGLFSVDDELSDEQFTRVTSKAEESIPLVIDFSVGGVDVHLDSSSEVFSWGNNYIENHPKEIYRIFNFILISKIEVESFNGKMKKIIFMRVEDGEKLHEIKVYHSLLINPFKKTTKSFLPMIPPIEMY